MAIIKCEECGRKISDLEKQCIYCGCPIEKVLCCEECGSQIKKHDTVCNKCGCPIETIKSENINFNIDYKKTNINNRNNYNDGNNYYDDEIELARIIINKQVADKYKKIFLIFAIISTIMIITIPYAVYFYMYYFYIDGCKNNNVILTNKRIHGTFKTIFGTSTINMTHDKIDNICTDKNIFKIDSIYIHSNSRINAVLFADNGEEFCSIALEEIEKYKMYMYGRKY